MEEQLSARLAEGQIAQFVDDDEVMAQVRLDDPAASTGGLLLLELVDEIDEVEEEALALDRITAVARAIARWVLPVPVPP